jgi:hypothetical protein
MMHETTDKKWFDELVLELRLRQVHGSAIGDTVASARELLGDTGQRAEEAFGPARVYAAALELPSAPQNEWVRRALWPSLLGLLAFLLFNQAVVSWVRSEQMLVSPAQLALVATPVVRNAVFPARPSEMSFSELGGQISVLVTARPYAVCEVVFASSPDDTASRAGHHLERQAITLGPQAGSF